MKRYLSHVLYLPLAGGLIFASYHYARNGIMRVEAQQAVHVKPYSAEYVLMSYVTNPKGEVQEKRHVARRSDGAMSTAVTVLIGPEVTPHRTVILPDGRRILLNDSQALRTTFYMKDQELANLKNALAKSAGLPAETNCGKGEPEMSVGTDHRLGYETQVWRTQNKSDNGMVTYRMDVYRAPELGCADLDTIFGEVQPDGKLKAHWTLTAQSVNPAEPPEADFDSGPSYAEVLPSEFDRRTYKAAAITYEASKTAECANHKCGPVEDLKAQWSKQDSDYKARLSANGGK
jgi:hypothetical protein